MWQSIINWVTDANAVVNGIVWGWPVIILILGTGLLLSIRTGFLQVCRFGNSMNTTIVPVIRSLGKKSGASASGLKTVSQFEAFSTAISGTVGTGNIVGVTAAILTGGPGAVLWMWISAFFGMVTNYSENVLGLFYRKKDEAKKLLVSTALPVYEISDRLQFSDPAYFSRFFKKRVGKPPLRFRMDSKKGE